MKKLLFLVTALLAMVQQSSAQTITVADVEAVPGETVAFSLNLTGGKVNLYTALQFDVQFPATGFSTITGGYTVNTSAWLGASCTVGSVDETGLATIPFASSEAITAADVENLVSISFNVANTVAIGEYNVTIKNLWFGYNESDKDYLENVTFKVKVVERHTVVLNETDTDVPASATGVDVTVNRTINANEWSTICLPFAMNAEQVTAAFGSGVELADFRGADTKFDNDDNVIGITVNFNPVTAIEANRPYIIKVVNKVTTFTMENVDINSDENNAYFEFDNGKTGSKRVVYSGFYGTYHAETVLDNNTLFLSGNKFWYSSGNTKMKAFRAYFDFLDVLTDKTASGARMLLSFDEETTSIQNPKFIIRNNTGEWYTLDGRKLDKKPTAKGVYVKDGRKVVIK